MFFRITQLHSRETIWKLLKIVALCNSHRVFLNWNVTILRKHISLKSFDHFNCSTFSKLKMKINEVFLVQVYLYCTFTSLYYCLWNQVITISFFWIDLFQNFVNFGGISGFALIAYLGDCDLGDHLNRRSRQSSTKSNSLLY